MSNTEEATLKDVIIAIRDYSKELKKKFLYIFVVLLIFFILGLVYSSNQNKKYEAVLSFIVQGQSEGSNLSSISGMASQFGFDLGGGSSSSYFSQQNVIELLKSRKIIESTLSKKSTINNEEDVLLNHYISINKMEDSDISHMSSKSKDSIINIIWQQIINYKLDISYQNDDANILNLTYSSINSEFAKNFTVVVMEEMS